MRGLDKPMFNAWVKSTWVRVAALYLTLTLIITFPVVTQLTTHLAGEFSTSSDTLESVWGIWWWQNALFQQSPLNITALNYPDGQSYPLYPLAAQVFTLGGLLANLVSAPIAYNLLWLASFWLSALATYAFCLEMGVSTRAAFIGGLIWGFFPAKNAHAVAGHLFLIFLPTLPLAALALRRALRAQTPKQGMLAGLACILAATTHPTFSIYFLLPVALALWFEAQPPLPLRFLKAFSAFGLTLGVGLGLLAWPTLNALASGQTVRASTGGDVVGFSPDALGFFTPSVDHPLWSATGLRPWLMQVVPYQYEHFTYIGLVALALAVWGVRVARTQAKAWMALAIVCGVLALGPLLKFNGAFAEVKIADEAFRIVMPYAFLAQLPVLEWGRTPGRLSGAVMLAVAVLATHGVNGLLKHKPIWVWGMLAVFILADGLARWPMPTTPLAELQPPSIQQLGYAGDGKAVLQVPVIDYAHNQRMLFWQTLHQHPLVGGRVYRELPEVEAYAAFYRQLALQAAPEAPAMLHAAGIGWLMYDAQADPNGQTLATLTRQFGSPRWQDNQSAVFAVTRNSGISLSSTPIQFEGQVELVRAAAAQQARPGQPLGVTLEWRALNPTEDLTLFVQLLNSQGQLAAQFDGPPVARSPATSLWLFNMRSVERITLNLPSDLAVGTYQLQLGLYRLPEVQRLENGLPDSVFMLGSVNVQP